MTYVQGNVQQLEARINNQILGVKGLKYTLILICMSHLNLISVTPHGF